MKKRKDVLNKDVSNRAVIIVLVLVICISVISLGIYVSAVDDFSQKSSSDMPQVSSGEVSLVIDAPAINSTQNISNETEGVK